MADTNMNSGYGLPRPNPQPVEEYEIGDSSKWAKILSIVSIILIVILAGFIVWLFIERNSLQTQLSSIQREVKDGTIEVVQNDSTLSNLRNTVTTDKIDSDNGDEKVLLGKAGKQTLVGINTQNPATELYIKAASQQGGDPEVVLENASGDQKWELSIESANKGRFGIYNRTAKTSPFFIGAGAPTGSFFINDRGYVGLGTVNPSQRLHVNGNIQISGLKESGFADKPVCFDNDGVLRQCRD